MYEKFKFAPDFEWIVPTPQVVGKVTYNPNHPEFRAFEYLKSVTPAGVTPKVVVPSPNFLFVFRDWRTNKWPSSVCFFFCSNFLQIISMPLQMSFLLMSRKHSRKLFFVFMNWVLG
jgi:hypothetical protein